jgi:predicted nucleic acid-binding protein
MVYLESSAIVKLVVRESGVAGLDRFLETRPTRVSSVLSRIEASRALLRRRSRQEVERDLEGVLPNLDLMPISEAIASRAAVLGPPALRSLDAIHLATALTIGPELEAMVTYDHRLADAAREMGIAVYP